IGAPVGKLAHAGRAGADARQVEHPDSVERSACTRPVMRKIARMIDNVRLRRPARSGHRVRHHVLPAASVARLSWQSFIGKALPALSGAGKTTRATATNAMTPRRAGFGE